MSISYLIHFHVRAEQLERFGWNGPHCARSKSESRSLSPNLERCWCGRSTDPGSIDYDSLADDLHALLEQLDLCEVTIVAHSGAAGEIVRYATRHGHDRLARIVMVSAMGPLIVRRSDNPDGVAPELIDAVVKRLERDLPSWIEENAEPFAPGISPRMVDWIGAAC